MTASWKTTLCGLLGGLCLGLAQIEELTPLWTKIFYLLGGILPNVGLLFARDNKVTSEQATGHPSPQLPLKFSAWLVVPISLALLGCAGLVTVKKGADPVVVNAEWLAENSLASADSFLEWERSHPEAVAKKPALAVAAEQLRERFPSQLAALRAATKLYKREKTAANGDKLKAMTLSGLQICNSIRAEMGLPPLILPAVKPSVSDLMKNAPTNAP